MVVVVGAVVLAATAIIIHRSTVTAAAAAVLEGTARLGIVVVVSAAVDIFKVIIVHVQSVVDMSILSIHEK